MTELNRAAPSAGHQTEEDAMYPMSALILQGVAAEHINDMHTAAARARRARLARHARPARVFRGRGRRRAVAQPSSSLAAAAKI